MKTNQLLSLLAKLPLASLAVFWPHAPAYAAGTPLTPSLQFAPGLTGQSQALLTWPAQPGVRYRVQRTDSLSPDGWSDRALVLAGGTTASWIDPEAPPGAGNSSPGAAMRAFYRVPDPVAEVFSVSPAVFGPQGGVFTVEGQCLPAGSSLVFEIEGQAPLSVPLQQSAPGQYRAVISPGAIAGIAVGAVISARVTASTGQTVCAVPHYFAFTENGRASDSPPVEPPAVAPGLREWVETVWNKQCVEKDALGPGSDQNPDGADPGPSFSLLMPALMKAKEKANRTKCGNNLRVLGSGGGCGKANFADFHFASRAGLPGEVVLQQDDLALATPAGPPIVWTRTYRSKGGGGGGGWTSCYDMRIEPVPLAAGAEAPRLKLWAGDGSSHIMVRQANGTYVCDGMFREGRFDPDTTFRLTFADKSQCIFCRLVGAPWSGRIGRIQDANGVGLDFTYNAASKLQTVASQFGQSLTMSYNAGGLLQSITDHTGRRVDYTYYDASSEGPGSPGDLKTVSCPQVPGQPPLMGPTTFSYTAGFADDARNHNLVKVTDGAGRSLAEFTYAAQANPSAVDYDTCASSDLYRDVPLSGNVTLYKFEIASPAVFPPGSYLMIENDPVGRVTECVFDAQHRCVSCREYTGFAAPGVPVTSTTNRPTAASKRRPADPDFYETTCAYNPDHRIKNRRLPDGTQELITYERELIRESPSRITAGNARVITLRTAGGEERTVYCDYAPGFGTCEDDARPRKATLTCRKAGDDKRQDYLAWSNSGSGGDRPMESISFNFSKIEMRYKSRKEDDSVWDGGDGEGGCTNSFARGGKITKSRSNIQNNRLGMSPYWGGNGCGGTDTKGEHKKDCTCETCKRVSYIMVHHQTPHSMRPPSPPWGPVPGGFCTVMTTAHGQRFTASYDTHGNCTSSRTPVDGAGCDATYNSLGQCTSVTVLNGPGSSFREDFAYHATQGWLIGHIQDPDVNGTGAGLNITTTCDRDALGRVTRVVDPRGFDWLTEYDVCDRITVCRTPAVGTATPARISTNFYYDNGGECVRCDMEHRDESGALVAANPAYTGWLVYDSRSRVSRIAIEQRPVDAGPASTPVMSPPLIDESLYAVTGFTFNDAGECIQCTVPAASRGQAKDRVCLTYYDERGLEWKCQDGLTGAPGSTIVQIDYTPAGMIARRMLLPTLPPPPPVTPNPEEVFTYDGFQRLSSVTDPMGNVTTYEYDEQGFTTVSVYGEVNDVPGSGGNVLLFKEKKRPGRESPTLASLGRESPTRQSVRESPTKASLGLRESPTRQSIRESPTKASLGLRESPTRRSCYFDVFVSDEISICDRFAAGAPAPHETETTTVHRSPAGLVTSVTINGDLLLTCTYDTAGRPATTNDGFVVHGTVRDQAGNVVLASRTDVPGSAVSVQKVYTWTRVVDALGRTASTTDGGGNTVSCAFDSFGRTTQCTDQRGVIHRFRYDGSTGGTAGTPPAPYTCLHECDVDNDGTPEVLGRFMCWSGECRSVTDSYGHSTLFTCDSAGNRAQCDFPDGTHETYGFDSYGRSNSLTHKDGTVSAATYNLCGETVLLILSGGAPGTVPVAPTEYRYDGLGRLVQCDQGDSHLTFSFDSLGNELSESHNGMTITRTFTHRGRSSITYPDGTKFSETRDAHGKPTMISRVNSAGVTLSPPVSTVSYLGHRPASETRANGVVTTYEYRGDGDPPLPGGNEDFSYDECVRTVCISAGGTVLQSTRVRRDRAQNITQHDAFFSGAAQAPGRRHVQTFDRLGRLTQSVISRRAVAGGQFVNESTVTYTLDLEGRRLSAGGSINPGIYTQNAAIPPGDQQMGQYSAWPGGPLEWDDQGCLTFMSRSTGGMQCLYDQASRLVAATDFSSGAPVQTTYAYDALGRRTRSSTASSDPVLPPVTTFFVYDGATCVQELGGDGLPNFTMAAATGVHLCITSRNGTLVYPHGGGPKDSSSAAMGVAIPKFLDYMKKGKAAVGAGGGCGKASGVAIPKFLDYMKKGKRSEAELNLFTSPTGTVTERLDFDDAGRPLFLTSDGAPRPGATDTLNGFRWMAPECIWCPESRFLQLHGGVYSPELGTGTSEHKEKPKPKPSGFGKSKELTGHVTLIK